MAGDNHRDHGLGHRDQGRVKRVGIGAADDVGPGLRVKLLRDPDELEAILRRQDGLRDGDRVMDTSAKRTTASRLWRPAIAILPDLWALRFVGI